MYPKLSFISSDLQEHFTPISLELNIINKVTKPINRLGFAVLLKCFQYLGYFPQEKEDVPLEIVDHIAPFLELRPDLFKKYNWKKRSYDYHLNSIRDLTGFKLFGSSLLADLISFVTKQKSFYPDRKNVSSLLVKHFREIKIELPSEKEYGRLVNTLRKAYFDNFYSTIYNSLDEKTIENITACLDIKGKKEGSYSFIKSSAGDYGLKTLLKEILKLNCIRNFNISSDLFEDCHPKLIEHLYRPCRSVDSSRLKELNIELRISLVIVYFYIRQMEITDGIIKVFLELIRRIEKKSKSSIEKEITNDIKKNYNKQLILKKVSFAINENPKGSIEEVILSKITLETFSDLAKEFSKNDHKSYRAYQMTTMKRKYTRFYRQMMKPILEALDFKTGNKRWEELLKGIDLIHKYIDTKHIYYPFEEKVPMELLKGKYKEMALEESPNGIRIKKHYFELCVLDKLEKTLKCKEIFVEGANHFQNPEKDLPSNWKEIRSNYYDRLSIPIEVKDFISPLKREMEYHLLYCNDFLSVDRKNDVYIYRINERGFFRVPRIKKKEERPILKEIHKHIGKKWGIVDLLDIFVEADKQINFSQFFYTSAQREILSDVQIRERLLLVLFSLGTNIGLKRVHKAANPNCSYRDLLYFKDRYINPDSLRETIVALTNKVLSVRNPLIWGEYSSACVSDGKQFRTFDQNLMADSNPHYREPGVMVYWHLDSNALCIHSQIKNCNSSEIVAMIQGLVRHAIDMKIESNFVDSKGQSEIAFAFCYFLGLDLMPRLKQIKKQKLYLPNKEIEGELSSLKGVLNKPIRWDLIKEQYDQMVKHVAAILERPEATESILRRFLSYNKTHPTYKAFLELGRACKTIFLCKYLVTKDLRHEIHEGLNIVESWNSVNTFLCFGSKSEFQTNDPYTQELIVLSLHLLQNSMILANTIMIDRVIEENNIYEFLTEQDKKSLNPLGNKYINPYGGYHLDFDGPSFLEAA